MIVNYRGKSFPKLIQIYKNFIWFVYDDFQLGGQSSVTIKPSWVDPQGVVSVIDEMFPSITIVESIYSDVSDELIELGYDLRLDQNLGGLWDSNNEVQRPVIIGFQKGWKTTDSIGFCYCSETVTKIIFEIYPELLDNYLNQPV